MNHGQKFNKLGRDAAHRKALLKNLSSALFTNGYIVTTLAKAKALRPFAEKIITQAVKVQKSQTISQRIAYAREIEKKIQCHEVYLKLINVWGIICLNRPGGYLRIVKLSNRKGDNADQAYIGIVLNQKYINDSNQLQIGYKSQFELLAASLQQDQLMNNSILQQWLGCKMPEISMESSFESTRSQKRIAFTIHIGAIDNLEDAFWPIFDGVFVKLPLTLQLTTDISEDDIQFNLSIFSNATILPAYHSKNIIKVILQPSINLQEIHGEINIKSNKRSSKSQSKEESMQLKISGPSGDLYLYNF